MSTPTFHDDRPGVAVFGTGFGCLTHIPALRQAGFDVRALVGTDPVRTEERAARFEVPHACTSPAEALALPGVRAVTVATPPQTHAELVLRALDAGKHVLCEKPFARDAAEARRMLTAARRAGVVHLLGSEFRWATGQALAAQAIADGAIGTPRLATILLQVPMFTDPKAEAPGWWFDPAAGGGWLGAHAAHTVDQIRTTLGEFEALSASLTRLVDRPAGGAEDSYTIHFRLRTGVEGVLQSSVAAHGPLLMLNRIVGSAGTLWIEGDQVHVQDATGRRTLTPPSQLVNPAPVPPPADLLVTAYDLLHSTGIDLAPYTRLAGTFRELIAGRPLPAGPAPATFADGLAITEVLDAARRSAADRCWVELK